jgi:hypothetical protein
MRNIWIETYKVTLKNKKQYQIRLNELLEWNKPFCNRENDKNGLWIDYDKKIDALKFLLKIF